MKRKIFAFGFLNVFTALLFQTIHAQNTSPYWSLKGNKNATTSSKFGTTNNTPLLIFTKNTERLRIDASGKIGIGTKNPSYKLHVEGGSSFAAVYGNDSFGYGVYGTGGAYGVYGNGNDGVFGWSNSGHYGVYGLSDINYADTGCVGVYGEAFIGVKGNGSFGVSGKGEFGVSGDGSLYGVYATSTSTGVWSEGDSIGISAAGGTYGIYAACFDDPNAYAGYFSGDVFTSGVYSASDSSLKKNISDVASAMEILNKLKPKLYEYRQDGNYKLMHLSQGKHFGFLAQDLEQVLPGLIKETKFETHLIQPLIKAGTSTKEQTVAQKQSEDIDFKAVNYTEIIPILVKAVQEQQIQIEKQQTQIEELKNEMSSLKQDEVYTTDAGILNQAIPNPTNGITHISYRLPKGIVNAQLLISDMAGNIINAFPLDSSGNIDMNTSSLSNGVYNYSLQADGKILQTKKLVVAR